MDVVALVPARDHVSTRYRVLQYAHYLAQHGLKLVVEPIERLPIPRLQQILRPRRGQTVLIQRKLFPIWQIALLKRSAGALVYDFDDAVFYRDSFDARGPFSLTRAARFQATIRMADLVVAGNKYLAEFACRSVPARKVEVVPTCVDARRYQPAEHAERRPTRLVWIGSSSTLPSLEGARNILEHVGKRIPNTKLKVICNQFPQFQHIEVERAHWSQAQETSDLRDSDIGISWLADDHWSRGKCGLKVLQYMAAGLPVVASPVGVHSEIVGRHGFLPASAKEWVDTIRRLSHDALLRDQVGREGRRRLELRFDVNAWGPVFAGHIHQAALRA
jgi:glycosyltransferase involved in cell wall biosynthesis